MIILTVEEGNCNEAKVAIEMKHLFDTPWVWSVRQIKRDQFVIEFPSQETRRQLTRLKDFSFQRFKIRSRIRDSNRAIDAFAELLPVWVKDLGVPAVARSEKLVKSIARLVVKPIEVDPISLIRAGPVRVKVKCRDPARIAGTSKFF
ncbi:hypothetical protein ABZP36_003358 [Zizania latifolia]